MFFLLSGKILCKMPSDPLLDKQFDINNVGVYDSEAGEDLNLFPIWSNENLTGKNVVFSIAGNGCYNSHQDLIQNQLSDKHFNFDDNTTEVQPSQSDKYPGYSTGLLGIALGEANDICTAGISHESNYICIKSTKNDIYSRIQSIKYENSNTDIKLIALEKLFIKEKDSSDYVKFYSPLENKQIDSAIASQDAPIFITSSGFEGKSGFDTNFDPISRNPNVITVSDTTPSGSRSYWSGKGSSILINSPSGGSSNIYGSSRDLPHPPTIGIADPTSCDTNFTSYGVGSANVAGIVGLMLEANNKLTYREIQTALIISAVQNDPKHESWTTNSAKYHYSNLYGFGRADAERAIDVAKRITTLPEQKSAILDFHNLSLYSRMNYSNITSHNDTNIPFIEYLKLSFKATNVRSLNLDLLSPSGTKLSVSRPVNTENEDGTFEYIIRGFFGEKSDGNWSLFVSTNEYQLQGKIEEIKLEIFGFASQPSLPSLPEKKGHEKKYFDSELKFEVPQTIICEEEFSVKINSETENLFDLFLVDKDKNSRFLVKSDIKSNQETKISIPCHLTNVSLFVYIENRENKLGKISQVNFVNKHKSQQIISPKPYESLNTTDKKLTVHFTFADIYEKFGSEPESHSLIAGLYDIENNKTVSAKTIDIFDNTVTFDDIPEKTNKFVFYLTPLMKSKFSGCNTLIQPIVVNSKSTTFSVPLSSKCPVPPGVTITPQDEEEIPANMTLRIIYVASFLGVCLILMMAILMWHCCCRAKEQTFQQLDSVPLVSNE